MKKVWDWIWPILVGVLVAWGIMHWVVSFAVVPTSSMYPTIPNPCYILVNHLATETSPIHEGEVIVFKYPDDPSQIFVKRVIGLPGETVTIHGGHVYIDNHELAEPYLHGLLTEGTFGPYHVPAGHYFVMGDNRQNSYDSRYWTPYKYVPRSYILGEADAVIWPLSKMKPIPQ
ncbi:signal peptidase I [Alicyclobacillus tolerans]|uniref:Signal peptidase I n=2 Tax=Alicyclobacillus tolerans TaxID=90970 RepID=A0ABT9LUN5_9BACL|nr:MULTISPECIES: signal peptidase I [Alicyclobacillus]MDP9727962.1 signal peptidase I [Alicyclobacillus tengchongensis]QRF24259.1 signal peptidase I [Alicyclobacillus sp. TC]SHK63801.1 signal peptidase I [Alicyclobacillus montanus]